MAVIPVTETRHPVHSRMWTLAPAKPPVTPLSTKEPYDKEEYLDIW